MNTTENNKLIAEFNGEVIEYELSDPLFNLTYNFHKSWDRLMPVVEKIRELNVDVELENNCTRIAMWNEFLLHHNISKKLKKNTEKHNSGVWHKTSLLATYWAVVEFIKWYKKNKED